jgi:hypothetical protein
MLVVGALKMFLLPPLPLISTQIINVEWAIRLHFIVQFTLHINETLPTRVNREPPKVSHDLAPPQSLRYRTRRSASAEKVRYKVSFAR